MTAKEFMDFVETNPAESKGTIPCNRIFAARVRDETVYLKKFTIKDRQLEIAIKPPASGPPCRYKVTDSPGETSYVSAVSLTFANEGNYPKSFDPCIADTKLLKVCFAFVIENNEQVIFLYV